MQRPPSYRVLVLCALFALPTPALAVPQAPPSMDDALTRIGTYATQALAEQGAPGMMLAVTDRTHTLRLYPVGYANLASKTPVTDATRFGIGSITKSMTATALLQLRDAGKFDPQQAVTAYLPWFRVRTQWRAITPHDLFTHTSGLVDGGLSTGLSAVYGLRDWPTGFAPGTHWSYSNVGYDTLGAILETLDGANYPEIVQRRVFAPLGMTQTTAEWSPQALQDAATGYLYRAQDVPPPQHSQLMTAPATHYVDPAGSVLSTGEDMARYMRFLLSGGNGPSGRILSPSSFALLTSPGMTGGRVLGAAEPGMYHRYGYGLAIVTIGGDTVVAHTGGVIAYTACMMVDLTRGFGAIALSNLGYVGPRPCAAVRYAVETLQAQAKGAPLPPLPVRADAARVENAAQYAGVYRRSDGVSFRVDASADRLTLQRGAGAVALYQREKDAFWADDPRFGTYLLRFARNARGVVTEASYGPQWYVNDRYSGPRSFTYPRAWNAYTGEYEAIDANGYYSATRVYILKGRLVADGDELVPAKGSTFHVGTSMWEPNWITFEEPVGGRTQLARIPGLTMYRVQPF